MSKRTFIPKSLSNTQLFRKRTIGGVPGAIVFTGDQKLDSVEINYIEYNEDNYFEETVDGESIATYHEPNDALMQWYDIRGLHNTALIEEIGFIYHIHPLVLEDVADTQQRPKYEEYDQGNFITLRALRLNEETMTIESQQISLYFGTDFLVSFQETDDDLYGVVKNRLRNASGRIRQRGADYLAYTLIDAIADRYFTILDRIEQFIEETEIEIGVNPNNDIKSSIHDLKMELLVFRKSIVPLREAIGKFVRSDSSLVDERTIPFLQDLFDHVIQITDLVESQRDSLIGLQDLYMSEVSFRMNKVMQLLTVVTTIFIPLSFLTGLYGMNFEYMPELHSKNGYFILLGVMAFIVIALLYYFKRQKWL